MTTEINFDADGYGPTLHKLDSKAKHRTWQMRIVGNKYQTISGLAAGKKAISDWTVVSEAKSQDTLEAQAAFEVRAKYKHQLDREYHASADTIDTPKMIEPMLAKKYTKFQPGYAQPKFDGIRCIMTKAGMFTRQGQPITAVPHLHAGARDLFEQHPGAILDGELYNHDLRDDFGAISSIVRKKNPTAEQLEEAEKVMEYHVYDTVLDAPFADRFVTLIEWREQDLLGFARLSETRRVETEEAYDNLYAEWIGKGYEGGMLRPDGDEKYGLGSRSKFLLKRKDFETAEFEVLRVEEGQGNWSGAAKRFVLLLPGPEHVEFGAGVRGNKDTLTKTLEKPWPTEVTLRFFGKSPDGIPRFPVVIDMHYGGRKD